MTTQTKSVAGAFGQFQAGNFKEAERVCRQVLQGDPEQAEALHLLGIICHKLGKPEVAIDYLSQAVARNPSDPSFHNNFGAILRALGKPAEAARCLRKAVALRPDVAQAHYNLGVALYDQGESDEAIRSYKKAIELEANYAQAYNNLGMAYKRKGELQHALEYFAKAMRSDPHLAEASYNTALIYLEQGQIEEAIKHLQQALRVRPTYPEAHCTLGCAFRTLGKIPESVACFEAALRSRPDYAEAQNQLGVSLHIMGRLDEALDRFREAISSWPNYATAYSNMGTVLGDQGELQEALSSYRKALEIWPNHADAAAGQASIHHRQGRIDEAYGSLRPFLEGGSNSLNVALVFAMLADRLKRQGEAISLLERVLSAETLPAFKEQMIHFSLGKLYDDLEQYDQAFSHYQRGNALAPGNFDRSEHELALEEVVEAFSAAKMRNYPRSSTISDRPVFIVGMPRSGTSLVEQILASHPAVYGAGELEIIEGLVSGLPDMLGSNERYPRCMEHATEDMLERVAEKYLDELIAHAPDAARITDKMLKNYLHLGLIALLFPRARVIHCVRDALDTCLSCYFHKFVKGHGYSYSLEGVGVCYRGYSKLMGHWYEVLEIPILKVCYEDLVANPEKVGREMVGFCGLEWDERCMRFYEAQRVVKTGSYDQVNRPIYKTSVGKSRHYEQYLGPLVEMLEADQECGG